MKKSIFGKIIRLNVFSVVFALLLMGILSSFAVKKYIEEDITRDLKRESKLFLTSIGVDGDNRVIDRESLIEYKEKIGIQRMEFESENIILIKVPRKGWQQLSSTNRKLVLTDEEIDKVRNSTRTDGRLFRITLDDQECLAVALPALEVNMKDSTFDGIIITYMPTTQVNDINRYIFGMLILSMLSVGIISIIIGWLISRKMTRPIKQLKGTAEKLANRDFKEKADIKTGDEIEDLAIAINTMADSIQQYDTNQKEFFQNISHELKTPLMSIQGYAEGLKEDMFEDKEHALDIIIDESQRIKKFVDDIIFLSKLDTVEEFFDMKECSVNQIIINAIEKIESIAILNDIDIYYTPGEDIRLIVDEDKMIQVIINLLSNCLKYTKDTIDVETTIRSNCFEIRICDNGKGFGDIDLNKLFDRFYKGEKEGSGLGMSIVKKIVQGHQGEVTAHNIEAGGAEFLIKLPK
ncbi:sensor histidine kinase [Vallitalea okinawensis]|uniref:sensor histidine kinase n=1 Tax=Vallitalea okinawensis TaxID=2078660 RepID=UPI000CFB96B7|nr:HAMP domain-containing sensor histidine kinase [Vallitalea okinawensis]